MIKKTYTQLREDVNALAEKIKTNMAGHHTYDNIYAVPRGGIYVGALLAEILDLELVDNADNLGPFTLIVDDMIDSGSTRLKFWDQDFAVLYKRDVDSQAIPTYSVESVSDWVEFPWENTQQDINDHISRLLEFAGKTVDEENILEVKNYLKEI